MNARLAALACAGLWTLSACTGAPTGAGVPPMASGPAGPSAGPSVTASAPAATTPTASTPSAGESPARTPSATAKVPDVIVLGGTAIGGQSLGHARVSQVDPLVVAKLGRATVDQPLLCRAEGDRAQLAVVDHRWAGLTVRYGSSGAAATAIGWSVDLAHVPDGFRLAGGLEWRPPFAVLTRMPGVTIRHSGDRQLATLSGKGITWSGPAGTSRPDVVSGGPLLTCG